MHVFLYEWATGGGLVDEPGPVPASLVREGAAMIGALAADLLRIKDCRVSALRDPRVLQLALPGCDGGGCASVARRTGKNSSGCRRRRMRPFLSRRNLTTFC